MVSPSSSLYETVFHIRVASLLRIKRPKFSDYQYCNVTRRASGRLENPNFCVRINRLLDVAMLRTSNSSVRFVTSPTDRVNVLGPAQRALGQPGREPAGSPRHRPRRWTC